MKIMFAPALALLLGGCVASGSSGRVVRASAGEAETRWMIASTIASAPHFGGWSIIGKPQFAQAGLAPGRSVGSMLFGSTSEEYCVSATMIVAGIPQRKSAFVTVNRSSSVATARVRPGYCTATAPFPELEMVSIRR
ncbi:hypothetical protein [Bosea vaviloviae]|uniref:Lipoprotein n=1 Tax=Bosea vaviloviae TaxID=1526658 RepID=A0A1D7U5Y7_9HYPH|nr:hypothetical protein [Bosea vaviloviae]AOO82798.1 hypothetical protein BHK69_22290 [Bosea vaviloviae]